MSLRGDSGFFMYLLSLSLSPLQGWSEQMSQETGSGSTVLHLTMYNTPSDQVTHSYYVYILLLPATVLLSLTYWSSLSLDILFLIQFLD